MLIILLWISLDLSKDALELEKAGKLTMNFAGIVASFIGALTLVIRWYLHTSATDPRYGPQPPQYRPPTYDAFQAFRQPMGNSTQPTVTQPDKPKPSYTPPQPTSRIDPKD